VHTLVRSTVTAVAALWLSVGPGLLLSHAPTAAAAERPAEAGFSMVIASDPQLTWWRGGDDPDCSSRRDWGEEALMMDSCVDTKGKETNKNQVSAINRVMELGRWPETGFARGGGSPINTPNGVIVNGDLMATGHAWEWDLFKSYHGKDKLNYQPYWGLGNHDYENFAYAYHGNDDCTYYWTWDGDKNSCAKWAVWPSATISTPIFQTSPAETGRRRSRCRTAPASTCV
jgi:hypothetical protein